MPSIQHKRGTAAALTSANPTIASGEIVIETDTLRFKVGDGSTAWNSLSYATSAVSHTHAASDLTSGTVATARLGTGSASSTTFLRGDSSWASAGSTSASDLTSGTLSQARLDFIPLHPFLLMGG
jgi:hypothetical protein